MTWSDNIPEIITYLNKHGDKFINDPVIQKEFQRIKSVERNYYGEKGWDVAFTCENASEYGRYNLTYSLDITHSNGMIYKRLFAFNLSYYQACCAMNGLNNFAYDSLLSKEQVHELADLIIEAHEMHLGTLQRVLINFISRRDSDDHSPTSFIERSDQDVVFPFFYEWAKSRPKFQEMLMYNSNSGNIVRTCEVVIHGD